MAWGRTVAQYIRLASWNYSAGTQALVPVLTGSMKGCRTRDVHAVVVARSIPSQEAP